MKSLTALIGCLLISLPVLQACKKKVGCTRPIATLPCCSLLDSSKVRPMTFELLVTQITTSNIYEAPENWEDRGLIPSDEAVIKILRNATNSFLVELSEIHNSDEQAEQKLDKDKAEKLEARKAELADLMANADEPPPLLHPNMAHV